MPVQDNPEFHYSRQECTQIGRALEIDQSIDLRTFWNGVSPPFDLIRDCERTADYSRWIAAQDKGKVGAAEVGARLKQVRRMADRLLSAVAGLPQAARAVLFFRGVPSVLSKPNGESVEGFLEQFKEAARWDDAAKRLVPKGYIRHRGRRTNRGAIEFARLLFNTYMMALLGESPHEVRFQAFLGAAIAPTGLRGRGRSEAGVRDLIAAAFPPFRPKNPESARTIDGRVQRIPEHDRVLTRKRAILRGEPIPSAPSFGRWHDLYCFQRVANTGPTKLGAVCSGAFTWRFTDFVPGWCKPFVGRTCKATWLRISGSKVRRRHPVKCPAES